MINLTTKDLKLARIIESDRELFRQLQSNHTVREFLGGIVCKEKIDRKFEIILTTKLPQIHFSIQNLENKKIGIISLTTHCDSLTIELSYQILPEFWGQSISYQASKRVLEFAKKELQFSKVIAETQLKNKRSINLLERLGMKCTDEIMRFSEKQHIYSITLNP